MKAKVVTSVTTVGGTVDAAGKVTAVGVGGHLADVTVDGTTVSGSYPLRSCRSL